MYLSISYNLLSQKQSIIQSPPVLSTIILYHSRYSNTLHYHEPCNIFFDMIIRFFGCRMESEKPRRKKSSECICNVHRVWSRHSYGNWLSVITDVSVDSPVRYIALAIITSWIRRTREVLNSQSYIRPDTKRRIGHCYPCHCPGHLSSFLRAVYRWYAVDMACIRHRYLRSKRRNSDAYH